MRAAFVSRRRRILLAFGALAGVALLALGAAVVFALLRFSSAELRAEMQRQLHDAVGLVPTREANASLVLFPAPHIEFDNIGFSDAAGAVRVEAEYLRGYPRLRPLLMGRLELARLTLHRPELTIDVDANVLSRENAIGRAAAAAPATQEASRADAARLGIVVVEDGRARLTSRAAADATIDAINMTLDWRNLGAPVTLSGQAHIHHRPTDLALWIAAPSDLLRGGASAVRLRLNSDTLALSSSGSLSTMGGVAFRGRLTATGASLHDVVALLGYDVRRRLPADDFSIRSDVDFADDRLTLSSLRLHLLENDFEGAVAIETRSRRKAVSGTLAADTLKLAPFMTPRALIWREEAGWSDTAFERRALELADLDLRISAAHAALGDLDLTGVALSLLTRRGGLEIGLADATLYGGSIRGKLAVEADDEGLAARLAATLTHVDLAAGPWRGGDHRLSGRASGNVSLDGAGRDMAELVDHLTGHGEFTIEQGALAGIDIEQALRRAEKRSQTASVAAAPAGRTPFGLARIGLHVSDGVAQLDEATFSGPGSHIAMTGRLDLRRTAVDIDALALQAGTDGVPLEAGPRVDLRITGPFDNPKFEQTDIRPAPAAPN